MKSGALIRLSVLAKQWGWSVKRLHRLVAERRIPHVRIGARGDIFFEEAAIEQWLARQRVAEATHNGAPGQRSVNDELDAIGAERDESFV